MVLPPAKYPPIRGEAASRLHFSVEPMAAPVLLLLLLLLSVLLGPAPHPVLFSAILTCAILV